MFNTTIGPGFLESIYHNALKVEFARQNIIFESEKEVKIFYQGVEVGIHRLDLFVED
ncbi:MAG: GxxExxY protein [bacterium]